MIIYSQSFPHTVPLTTNMFLEQDQQCITFSLSAFFSPPSWPLSSCTASLQCYNVRSHHIQTFPLPPLVSFVLLFSISVQPSSFYNARIFFFFFYLSPAFISPWVLDLTSASRCVHRSLYVLSFDNPLESLSPIKSLLKCSFPVLKGFAKGWGLLCGGYVSHLEGEHMLCANRSVFFSSHRCAAVGSICLQ